jgi:hypothetical protein
LRHGGRTAHFTQKPDFHLKVAAIICDAQHIPNPNLARRFRGLAIGLNPPKFAGAGCQGSCLEKSRSPKPLVYSYACHEFIKIEFIKNDSAHSAMLN